ncbi:hypothetical protein ACJX0J_010976, partial [Zea mays]
MHRLVYLRVAERYSAARIVFIMGGSSFDYLNIFVLGDTVVIIECDPLGPYLVETLLILFLVQLYYNFFAFHIMSYATHLVKKHIYLGIKPEIDWMALQGINLPLAFTGQEGTTLANQIWMISLYSFAENKIFILDTDVLFWHVPSYLSNFSTLCFFSTSGPLHFLLRLCNFDCNFELLPLIKLGHLCPFLNINILHLCLFDYTLNWEDYFLHFFIRRQQTLMHRSFLVLFHIYNCDTFDENTPPLSDPNYISSLGAATFRGMQSGDNDAIWLMQGWLFTYDPFWEPPQMKALLHSVPVGKMIVLDLYAEVKPVWINSDQCMLHNFAADFEMYGVLDALASGPIDARLSDNSTMVGVGMSMEGIEQNPIVYDLMSEMAFHHRQVDLQVWVKTYPTRRYGKPVKGLQDAWWILYRTLYNCTDGKNDKNRDVIVAFPDVEPFVIATPGLHVNTRQMYSTVPSKNYIRKDVSSDAYEHPHLWYDTNAVIHALELFLQHGDEVSDSNTFRYDLVDLTRQVLAKYANDVFLKIIESYKSNNMNQVTILCQHFLSLVNDLDTLLSSHEGFLLGPWLESAKGLARNSEQEIQYEWNARTQITMWFDNTETKASLLRDY